MVAVYRFLSSAQYFSFRYPSNALIHLSSNLSHTGMYGCEKSSASRSDLGRLLPHVQRMETQGLKKRHYRRTVSGNRRHCRFTVRSSTGSLTTSLSTPVGPNTSSAREPSADRVRIKPDSPACSSAPVPVKKTLSTFASFTLASPQNRWACSRES